MTEKEQDEFLISLLKNFIESLKESNDVEKQKNYLGSETVISENEETIKVLSEITAKINSIEELAELDADAIDIVFEAVTAYAGDFVISADSEQRKKDMEYCSKIEEIIWLFYDEDDGEEEE